MVHNFKSCCYNNNILFTTTAIQGSNNILKYDKDIAKVGTDFEPCYVDR